MAKRNLGCQLDSTTLRWYEGENPSPLRHYLHLGRGGVRMPATAVLGCFDGFLFASLP